ncbi:MAG: D-alanyl-D-alanine carboxypeptidase [Frankiales bacterium]|nr:D-alanyl-D-alanine carboxypeptidase [Frankiales bacterium]
MRVRRVTGWAGLTCTAVAAALVVGPVDTALSAASPAAKPRSGPASVTALRADVVATSDRLAAATVAWQRGRQQMDLALQRSLATGRAIDTLQQNTSDAHQRLSALANSLYRNPVSPQVTAVLAGDVQMLGTLRYVQRSLNQSSAAQQRDVSVLTTQQAQMTTLRARQEAAITAAMRLQSRLDADLSRLQADAQASQVRLQNGIAELRRRQQAAAAAVFGAAGGAACSGPVPTGAINGFLPASALCPLATAPGHRLAGPAARAFDALSAAFAAAQGTALCVTDSYRDYAGQVSVFQRKPNLAATPGRSQHGWGRAVDLCGGVQKFGSPAFTWLKANAGAFGFVHPDWAEPDGSRPEPWHWEFTG